ncbi:hypothetical protein GGI25_003286 [Coemansia spiralis]|uniref:OBG-type G domain-containing protein n=2 Tax=Coemansia TaxID=4863 RepID=A0A9W8G6U5_9FUNG|nr:P-loop containing nucleoside triphosphate hydrolase protein [Coemansia spiralis]KAJ1989998.1 hypothetical protein EDC05_004350 [Coemansia umbellata]KAJ2621513.1 hypothetical protein GGI26_004093 [Coemansia sp. RSA 1358]KAJ2677189.1 hypothetical protein GGI25_003286 [Coemansia spiralis]
MSSGFVIACVGKPSAGKSSFLNAVTDAAAKVGNYPFTTIEPNQGIAYYPLECPCAQHHVPCKPRYGWCRDGTRYVPVRIIDVAGLVPGASQGRGLGNRFLDDLRTADVLVHVVDASGTTDAEGRETKGYDPLDDIRWLRSEIEEWVFGNLERKWGGTLRRHLAVKATVADTLHAQLAGYGTLRGVVQRALDLARLSDLQLEAWGTKDQLRRFVRCFLDVRFPTVVALNKIDMPDSTRNISAIMRKYRVPSDGVSMDNIVLTSALSEVFLRKMAKQKFILYAPGSGDFTTQETEPNSEEKQRLHSLDERSARRLENISDLVLFRYGSTGVQEVIRKAVDLGGFVPVFPVKSLNFANGSAKPTFQECVLVSRGTTVRECAKRLLHSETEYRGAETVGGIQLAEDEVVVEGRNIIRFT